MVGGNSDATVKEKNSKNISPMVSHNVSKKNLVYLNLNLMGLGFRLQEGDNKRL